jgi:hypothetical protein
MLRPPASDGSIQKRDVFFGCLATAGCRRMVVLARGGMEGHVHARLEDMLKVALPEAMMITGSSNLKSMSICGYPW